MQFGDVCYLVRRKARLRTELENWKISCNIIIWQIRQLEGLSYNMKIMIFFLIEPFLESLVNFAVFLIELPSVEQTSCFSDGLGTLKSDFRVPKISPKMAKLEQGFSSFFCQMFGIFDDFKFFGAPLPPLKNYQIWQKFGKKIRKVLFYLPETHFSTAALPKPFFFGYPIRH